MIYQFKKLFGLVNKLVDKLVFSHLDYVCKVFSFNVVVSLDENLSEDGFSNGVVFGIELVKPVERVTVLIRKRNQLNLHCNSTTCIQK